MVEPVEAMATFEALNHLSSIASIPALFWNLKSASIDVKNSNDLVYCMRKLPTSLDDLTVNFHCRRHGDMSGDLAINAVYDWLYEAATLKKLILKGRVPWINNANLRGCHRALRSLTSVNTLWIEHHMLDDTTLDILSRWPKLKTLCIQPDRGAVPNLRLGKMGETTVGRFGALRQLMLSASSTSLAQILSVLPGDLRLLIMCAVFHSPAMNDELEAMCAALSKTSPNLEILDVHLRGEAFVAAQLGTLCFGSIGKLKSCSRLRSFLFSNNALVSFEFGAADLDWVGAHWPKLRVFTCCWAQARKCTSGGVGLQSPALLDLEAVSTMAANLKELRSVSVTQLMICEPKMLRTVKHSLLSVSVHYVYHESVHQAAHAWCLLCPEATIKVTCPAHAKEWKSVEQAKSEVTERRGVVGLP
ncbi:hypothetical protein CALCODRAFT_536789 [Calocera cornea HHB12733]|uniref:RNI-like protein n=1 Tax=Calocera cornea HHB12733 TaxID=1353952 RepID=A0A165HNA7_9BASI|nr:hypothetical protein CALCODRAFT_536789 [Calocera cornea HHB12733]